MIDLKKEDKYELDAETNLLKGYGFCEWLYKDPETKNFVKIVLANDNVIAVETFFANYLAFDEVRRKAWKESMNIIGEEKYRFHLLDMLKDTFNESKDLHQAVKTAAADYIEYLVQNAN